MRTPRPPLLLEQCRAHLNAIYAPHLRQLPADAVIDCSYEPYSEPGKKGHGFTGSFAPIAKLTDMIVANHQRGDVYLGCGIQSMTKLHALGAKRGAGAALIGLPELWIDLDVHDDSRPEIRHKAANTANYPHPTLAEAYELIATIGITPTVVTRTSGGLHVHYSLTELLDLSVDSHKELFTMWRDAVVHAANAVHGRHIDSGVLSDRNRVLRPAGTISWKYSTPYLIQLESCDRTARLSHTGVREACDRILALEATFTAHLSAGGVAARTKPSQTAVRFDSDRALEAFSDRVSASDVLARTNQFNLVSGQVGMGVESYWDPAGAEIAGRRIHVHTSGVVTCFGEATATVGLGMTFDGTGGHANSYSLFRHLFCHGDSRLACDAIRYAAGDLDTAIRLAATGDPRRATAAVTVDAARTKPVRIGGAR